MNVLNLAVFNVVRFLIASKIMIMNNRDQNFTYDIERLKQVDAKSKENLEVLKSIIFDDNFINLNLN